MNQEFSGIILTLSTIKEDEGIPRNVKARIDAAITCLTNENKESCLKIDEILQALDEISNDPNLPSYTRIEILNIIGVLGYQQ